MQTYLFYDIETTGLNKAFDQILHFAAIRTDLNLNVLKEYDLKVKLNADVVPAPQAMITHRMKLSDISKGISEYEAIKKIHHWMNEPGTISLGYNTLKFDDEFLRFSFFRNLLPPYTHQYANDCSRMDIYPMTVMYYLFKNEVLLWPKVGDQISFKLEDLNKKNKFVSGRAHHAMVDVEVTIMLAKELIKERKMWDYLCGNFNKKMEQHRLQKIGDEGALMVLGKFGFKKLFQSQVLYLGEHFYYKNHLWLRLDDKDLTVATKDNIIDLAYVERKKLGEPGFLLPRNERFSAHLDVERLELANSNKKWLEENTDLLQVLSDFHRHYKYPEVLGVDIDASLYLNGFWIPEEENFCKVFHRVAPAEKSKLIETVTNQRLASLATRLLGRHFPDFLSQKQSDDFSKYIVQTNSDLLSDIIDYKGNPRLTLTSSLKQILELRNNGVLDAEQLLILDDLEKALQLKLSANK